MPDTDYEAQWKEWSANPTPQASGKMLRSLDPVIDSATKTHTGTLNPIVKGKARSMTLQALKTYNPSRGRLNSHIYSHLRGLKRYSAQVAQGVSIPERVSLDRRTINNSEQELRDNLGRDPTEDELADHSGFSTRRIKHVRRFNPGISEGMLSNIGENGEAYDPTVNTPGSSAWQQLVKSDLHPIDQKIFEYAQQNMPNNEMARKLRMTPGRVSQRKLEIQKLLDREQELSLF